MLHEISNSAHLEPPLPGKGNIRLASHHAGRSDQGLTGRGLTVLDELSNSSSLVLTGETAEFHSGLGVAYALAHAAGGSAQRENVAGADEACGRGFRVGEVLAAEGAVVGADSRGDAGIGGVDGDGVGGAAGVLAGGDHDRELEGVGAGGHDGCADEAGGVADHPGHLFGGDVFGGDD